MNGGGVRRCVLAGVGAALLAAQAPAQGLAQGLAQGPGGCEPPAAGTARVRSALDGRTLRLADGREVRLAGLEVPGGNGEAQAARRALAALVEGREVALHRLGPETDRHGRLLAEIRVAAAPSGGPQSVQQALVAAGHARVAGRVGDIACARQWLAAERAARAAGLGLWAGPHYVIRQAGNPGEILAERGRFTVVEGDVLSVRESGGTIYVNFGRRWSEDFTVTVSKRNERMFAAAGLDLKNLASRRVRVRGFVEERGGPWIEAARPEQIEIAERD
jgi:endonuclease YncB( thermonuclease family)